MVTSRLLKQAREVRDRQHRLRPELRLRTKEQVLSFIHDEGLVSFLGGNELPSFVSASLGKSWKPSKKGFTGWMDWWSVKISGQPIARLSKEVEGRDDILATRLFRRTKTFVSKKVWPTLDPVVKFHKDRLQKGKLLSELEESSLKTIENENEIRTDRLRKELGLEAKENNSRFHRALTNLESYSFIVGVEDPHPEKHLHANIWQTWEARTRKMTKDSGLGFKKAVEDLLERTVQACVLAPEGQVDSWFPWGKGMKEVARELVDQGRVISERGFLVSPVVTGR